MDELGDFVKGKGDEFGVALKQGHRRRGQERAGEAEGRVNVAGGYWGCVCVVGGWFQEMLNAVQFSTYQCLPARTQQNAHKFRILFESGQSGPRCFAQPASALSRSLQPHY